MRITWIQIPTNVSVTHLAVLTGSHARNAILASLTKRNETGMRQSLKMNYVLPRVKIGVHAKKFFVST